jgi:outer membrane receptor protein involved in Fe transport
VVVGIDASYADAQWTHARSPATVTNSYGMPIFNTPGEQVSFINLDGHRLGDTPRLTMSSHIDWSKKVSKVEVFTRGLWVYRGDRELLNVANPRTGGYGTVDVFAGLRDPAEKWSVTLWAKNVFNREVITSRSPAANIGNWFSGYTAVIVAPAREVGVTANYRF